jgi:hypothetical protein
MQPSKLPPTNAQHLSISPNSITSQPALWTFSDKRPDETAIRGEQANNQPHPNSGEGVQGEGAAGPLPAKLTGKLHFRLPSIPFPVEFHVTAKFHRHPLKSSSAMHLAKRSK